MKILFMLLILSSCASYGEVEKLTEETIVCYDAPKVVEGMKPEAVEKILGKPPEVSNEFLKDKNQVLYLYEDTLVEFTNGQVTEVFDHGK